MALALFAGAQSRSYGKELSELKQTDGYYEITSIDDFKAFANAVKDGQVKINGRLMADLDGFNEDCMVSTYEGHFDGQYHTITVNINAADEQGIAIFKFLQNGAVIENLGAKGTVKASNKLAASIVGDMYESTLRNCWSTVDITTSCVGDATSGGMIGRIKTPSVVENCIFAGSLVGPEAFKCGGLVGYMSKPGVQVTNCVVMGRYQLADNDNNTFNRKPENAVYTNCYYLNTSRFANVSADCTEITAEQVASGELCFLLNGDQTALAYYQSLSEDAFPIPNPSHPRVYSTANVNCDGTTSGGGGYTNDAAQAGKRQEHEFQHGFCVNCLFAQPDYLVAGEDGYFEIADGYALSWFASCVNGGKKNAGARLTADIDMSDANATFKPIGSGVAYQGTFDGQGHVISNLTVETGDDYAGMFGRVAEGVVVKNFVLDETCSISGKAYVGLIGGSSGSGTVTMECLGNEGSVTASAQNAGGIFGCNMSSEASPVMTNCYVTGTVKGASESAQLSGWLQNGKVTNCWATAAVSGVDGSSVAYRGSATVKNSFSSKGQLTALTEEMASNGELTFRLNGNQFANVVWYQTLGEDVHPTFNNAHGVVYCVNGEYGCVVNGDVTELRPVLSESGAEYVADMKAQKSLKEAYVAQAQAAGNLTTLAEIAAAYNELMKSKATLDASAAAYQSYINKVEEMKAYLEAHPELQGPMCDALQDYLQGEGAPSDENPYGESAYILDREELSAAELQAEIKRIDTWLLRVIAANATAGSEVTNLLVNANFAENYSGWSGKGGNTPSKAGAMPVGFCYGGTMNRYQTLNGVKNGVYELVLNGFHFTNRSLDNVLNTNYAATLYAGDNEVPIMAVNEDALAASEARDGENCWIQNPNNLPYDFKMQFTMDGDEFYVPSHETGASYAYKGGRYVNRILVNVTDGKLTLGLRVDNNGVSNNLTCFADARLYYLGEMNEAGDGVARVLDAQVIRANTILNNYEVVTDGNYALAPNFSQALRTELRNLLDEVGNTTDIAARYALIGKFSKAFSDIFEGKKAYRMMYDLTSKLDPQSILSRCRELCYIL
ncbi:MAG: hypothetical protein K5945_03560 [Bacteroidaceae bacterium]|nr:hypothetical protein [Bacteroidaceae bacterium]